MTAGETCSGRSGEPAPGGPVAGRPTSACPGDRDVAGGGLPGEVLGYRPSRRLRTTAAGTWYLAAAPDARPAGLLQVEPAADLESLVSATQALLGRPGAVVVHDLVRHGDRVWLITAVPPGPTLDDLLEAGAHRDADSAAGLLIDIGGALLELHEAGLAHGLVTATSVLLGTDGHAVLADWGTAADATGAADARDWARLTWLLARRWCAADLTGGAALAGAAAAATGDALASGLDLLIRFLDGRDPRASIGSAARDWLSAAEHPQAPAAQPRSAEPQPEATLLGARRASAELRRERSTQAPGRSEQPGLVTFGPGWGPRMPSGSSRLQDGPVVAPTTRSRTTSGSGYRGFLRSLLATAAMIIVIGAVAIAVLAFVRS